MYADTRMSSGWTGGWLLVCDLDQTLTGDTVALDEFVAIARRSPALHVVVNSSRPWRSVRKTLAAVAPSLEPLATITAMGTEVSVGGRHIRGWVRQFAGWDRAAVDRVMTSRGFTLHPPEFQTRWKASFVVPRDERQSAAAALTAAGVTARCIASGTSDFDVLPLGAGKDHATLYLAGCLGVAPEQVVVAGDSGNDAAMFRVCPRGIVVANARDELRAAVDETKVFFATLPSAAGVLQGLIHWSVPLGRWPTTDNGRLSAVGAPTPERSNG